MRTSNQTGPSYLDTLGLAAGRVGGRRGSTRSPSRDARGKAVDDLDVRLKRAYEPATASDGYRVLIDRLWPRGSCAIGPSWMSGTETYRPARSYDGGSDTTRVASRNSDAATSTSFVTSGRGSRSSDAAHVRAHSPLSTPPEIGTTMTQSSLPRSFAADSRRSGRGRDGQDRRMTSCPRHAGWTKAVPTQEG